MKSRTVCLIGLLVVAVLIGVGCVTGGKGPSDSELVQSLLGSWKGATLEKNIDKIMATYAENFSHNGPDYQAADKAGLRRFVEDCKQQGYFDGLEISFNDAATTIQGDTATISGVQCVNYQGSVTFEFTAKKGKTGWLFANMTIEGL